MATPRRLLWIGTYTPDAAPGGDGAGIHRVWFDRETGELSDGGVAAATSGPSFLAPHPSGHYVYAVNECAEGGVSAFAVEGTRLCRLNSESTGGAEPCHLTVDPAGRALVCANYADGSVAVHPIAPNGRLGRRADLARNTGRGPDDRRQTGPHAHHARMAPDGHRLLVTDLGTDELRCYTLDPTTGRFAGTGHVAARLPPGSGPRHFRAHPTGHLYVVGELDSTLHVLRWSRSTATATPVAAVATPGAGEGKSHPAEIARSRDGRYLYTSNRGTDLLSAFLVEEDGARVRHLADVPTGGACPRHFALVDGHIIVANHDSATLAVFRIDPRTGVPVDTGNRLTVPSPACVLPQ